MSLITHKAFLRWALPLFQVKRFRSKINIEKPKKPHFEKALFLEFTKPMYINPNKFKDPVDDCDKRTDPYKKGEDNLFQQIIAKEVYHWINTSRLVAFFHMNPMSNDQKFKALLMFKKQNMQFRSYGKKTMEMALTGTPYEAILQLYISRNAMVFSPEPEIKNLLKVDKKFPQLVLMAAMYEGKFISKDELIEYSLIPDLRTAQAGLVQTLNSIGGQIVGQLTTHQNALVGNLEERVKQLKGS